MSPGRSPLPPPGAPRQLEAAPGHPGRRRCWRPSAAWLGGATLQLLAARFAVAPCIDALALARWRGWRVAAQEPGCRVGTRDGGGTAGGGAAFRAASRTSTAECPFQTMQDLGPFRPPVVCFAMYSPGRPRHRSSSWGWGGSTPPRTRALARRFAWLRRIARSPRSATTAAVTVPSTAVMQRARASPLQPEARPTHIALGVTRSARQTRQCSDRSRLTTTTTSRAPLDNITRRARDDGMGGNA